MTAGIGSRPFQDLQQVRDSTARYVKDDAGGFRPAAGGTILGKVVNWLKETFRRGDVKQENVAAYTAAKDAFLAKGGSMTLAAEVFDPGIASGVRFSPAKINDALSMKYEKTKSDEIFNDLKMDAFAAREAHGLNLKDVNGASGAKLASQFTLDVNRAKIIVNGVEIAKDPVGTASGVNFCNAMRDAGATNDQISEISKYLNQRTIIAFTLPLQDPNLTSVKTPDGQTVIPVFAPGMTEFADYRKQTFEIIKKGPNFDISLVSREPITNLNAIKFDAPNTPSIEKMIPVDVTESSMMVTASMTFGTDKNGFMTLLSLDDAGYRLSAVPENGSRLA